MLGLKSMVVAGTEMKPLQHVLTVSFERESWLHFVTHIILLLHSHPSIQENMMRCRTGTL